MQLELQYRGTPRQMASYLLFRAQEVWPQAVARAPDLEFYTVKSLHHQSFTLYPGDCGDCLYGVWPTVTVQIRGDRAYLEVGDPWESPDTPPASQVINHLARLPAWRERIVGANTRVTG